MRRPSFVTARRCPVSKSASSHEGGLAADGAALFGSVRSLAGTLGAVESPLTIRSSRGLVSFFTSGEAGLGVRHGDDGFRPGVQERLNLVAGELGALLS
jgi:hypothetical protein